VNEAEDSDEEANFAGKGKPSNFTPNNSKFTSYSGQKAAPNLSKDFSKSKFGNKLADKPKGKPICFAFRDDGKCDYGDRCIFQHVKASTAFKVATSEELGDQEIANKIHHYGLKMAKYKKRAILLSNKQKMEYHRKSVSADKGKFKGHHKANLADEVVEDNSTTNDSANEEQAHVAAEGTEDLTDPFDLTSPDTSDQDA
jgi:hypothetical protein